MNKYTSGDLVDHIGLGAIIREDNKILIFYHHKFQVYTIPIGKLEPNEFDAENGIKRELSEELGINVSECKLVIRKDRFYTRPSENSSYKVKVDFHIYEVMKYSGQIVNMEPKKHSDLLWLRIPEIDIFRKHSMIGDGLKMTLDYLESNEK